MENVDFNEAISTAMKLLNVLKKKNRWNQKHDSRLENLNRVLKALRQLQLMTGEHFSQPVPKTLDEEISDAEMVLRFVQRFIHRQITKLEYLRNIDGSWVSENIPNEDFGYTNPIWYTLPEFVIGFTYREKHWINKEYKDHVERLREEVLREAQPAAVQADRPEPPPED